MNYGITKIKKYEEGLKDSWKLESGIKRFRSFCNHVINIIDSLSRSHLQPCSSLLQPCFSHKVALKQCGGSFFSASSQPIKLFITKERFFKRLMIIAKFYSERGRWGEVPRFPGKSPPRIRNNREILKNKSL